MLVYLQLLGLLIERYLEPLKFESFISQDEVGRRDYTVMQCGASLSDFALPILVWGKPE